MWGHWGTKRVGDDGRPLGLRPLRRPGSYPYAAVTLLVLLFLSGDTNAEARVVLAVIWLLATLPVVLFVRAWTGTRITEVLLVVGGRHGDRQGVHRRDITGVRIGRRPGRRFGFRRVLVDVEDGRTLVPPWYAGRWRTAALRRDIVGWQLGTGPRARAVDEHLRHRVIRPDSVAVTTALVVVALTLGTARLREAAGPVLEGDRSPAALLPGGLLAAAGLVLLLVLVRPRLVLEDDRYVVVNPVRRVAVPFAEVLALRAELCLTVDRSGRMPVTVWAVRPRRLLGAGRPHGLLAELRAWQRVAGHTRGVP